MRFFSAFKLYCAPHAQPPTNIWSMDTPDAQVDEVRVRGLSPQRNISTVIRGSGNGHDTSN